MADKPKWDKDWDLHLPLYEYDNLYLRVAIDEQRTIFASQGIFWNDGYEIAVHERFPFYFHIEKNMDNDSIIDTVKDNVANVKGTRENTSILNLLGCSGISEFFIRLKTYWNNGEKDRAAFVEADKILQDYFNVRNEARMSEFYYFVLKAIRMLNQRHDYEKSDYDILRYLIESSNRKLNISDTAAMKFLDRKKDAKPVVLPEAGTFAHGDVENDFGLKRFS